MATGMQADTMVVLMAGETLFINLLLACVQCGMQADIMADLMFDRETLLL